MLNPSAVAPGLLRWYSRHYLEGRHVAFHATPNQLYLHPVIPSEMTIQSVGILQ